MILLLANYLNNIEYFSAGETPEAQKTSVTPATTETHDEKKITLTLNDNKTTSNIVWFYVFICLCAFALSLYLNWRDNQPTSVCLICALYAWGAGVFYFIFIGIYYMLYYSKNNYYYVKFSKKFNTKNLKKIDITELENCINNLVPKK
jgi:hypothetical protein